MHDHSLAVPYEPSSNKFRCTRRARISRGQPKWMEELGFNESLEAPIRLHGGNESADPRYKIAIRFFLGLTSCSHPPRLVNIRHALHILTPRQALARQGIAPGATFWKTLSTVPSRVVLFQVSWLNKCFGTHGAIHLFICRKTRSILTLDIRSQAAASLPRAFSEQPTSAPSIHVYLWPQCLPYSPTAAAQWSHARS